MTESPSLDRVRLGRGLRFLSLRMIQKTGEVEQFSFSNGAFTLLTGPRNSSKTTTLKIIDYCLGDRDGVAEALGAAVEEKYQEVRLALTIDSATHTLTRTFTFGQRGRVNVDNDLSLQANELSDWLLQKLGWPQLFIPLGLNPATAAQLVPLTFRTLLRHIYRREDSWTEFANKEQEYLRRAVISMFLGFAPQRYETAEYDLGRAQRELAAAEAVYRDIVSNTDDSVRALVQQLGLPPIVDTQSLEGVRRELRSRFDIIQAKRESLTSEAEQAVRSGSNVPGLDPGLPNELERASAEAASAAERTAALQKVIEEHERSRALVESDISRLHRLVDAVELFDELPVRICPACEQAVDPERPHDAETCYLCGQEVSGDVRQRRAEREERALASELGDLAEAISHAREDLEKARLSETTAAARRTQIARALHDTRAARLAPYVSALEDLATDAGRIEQQLAALPALETIFSRSVAARAAADSARQEVDRLLKLSSTEERTTSHITSRCAVFAERMNEFVTSFQTRVWVEGSVTISADDLTFYVGTRPWHDSLGAEARVLFFMAYCYALLHLDRDLGGQACAPGVLLLDNPFQQGIRVNVVTEAINRLGDAANKHGVQIILTQSRNATNISVPHSEIRMPREYTS